jgi:type II secretion system protein C
MMTRAALVLVLLAAAGAARADVLTITAPADCTPAAASKNVRLALPAPVPVGELLKWAASTVCQTFRIDAALASRTVTVNVGAPMNVEQSRGLLGAVLRAAGLVVRLGTDGPEVVADGRKPKAKAATPDTPDAVVPLKAKLVATVVGDDPARRAIALRDAKGVQRIYGVGDRVAGEGAVVLGVAPGKAFLKLGKKTGQALLAGAAAPAPAAEPEDLRDAIKALDGNRYEVARRAAEWALKDPRATLKLVKVEADVRHGAVYGWKVSGFGDGSLPARLGAKSGDILVAINGLAAGDPDQVLAILYTLKTSKRVVVTVDRGGKELELEYLIR